MTRKAIIVAVAGLLALSVAFVAVGNAGDTTKCGKEVKKASAAKVSCSAMKGTAESTSDQCKKAEASTCKNMSAASKCAKTAAACSGKSLQCRGKKCSANCCASEKRAAHADELKKLVDDIPYRETKRLVLTGDVICGKCALGGLEKCQPMVKTSDAKLYPLVKNGMAKKMHSCGTAKSYKISGRVKKIHGVKYLDVTSFGAI